MKICQIKGDAVRVGIDADPSISIVRTELLADGRPSRPPAQPDARTEVGRLRAELALADECRAIDAGIIAALRDEAVDLHAELAGLRAGRRGA